VSTFELSKSMSLPGSPPESPVSTSPMLWLNASYWSLSKNSSAMAVPMKLPATLASRLH